MKGGQPLSFSFLTLCCKALAKLAWLNLKKSPTSQWLACISSYNHMLYCCFCAIILLWSSLLTLLVLSSPVMCLIFQWICKNFIFILGERDGGEGEEANMCTFIPGIWGPGLLWTFMVNVFTRGVLKFWSSVLRSLFAGHIHFFSLTILMPTVKYSSLVAFGGVMLWRNKFISFFLQKFSTYLKGNLR